MGTKEESQEGEESEAVEKVRKKMENLLEINERRTAVRKEKKVSVLKKVRKDGNVIDGNKRRITRMRGKSAWVEEV